MGVELNAVGPPDGPREWEWRPRRGGRCRQEASCANVDKDDIYINLRFWGKDLVSSPPPEVRPLLRFLEESGRGTEGWRDLDGILREAGLAIMAGFFEGIAEHVLKRGYEGSVREVEGQRQRFVGHREKTYRTLLGLVPVRRAAYQGKGKLHFPLDETLGTDRRGWTGRLQALVVEAGVEHDFESAAHWTSLAGVDVSAPTVWRVCNEAGAAVREREAEQPPCLPSPSRRSLDLAVEADGFMVNTEEGWKEILAGLVGRVPSDANPERLVEKTYVASFHERAEFWAKLQGQAIARGWSRARSRIFLSDGDRTLQDDAQNVFEDVELILDFYHAVEHLGGVAEKIFGPEHPKGSRWVSEQRHRLRRSQGELVIAAIGALAPPGRSARRACREQVDYFARNLERTRYLRFRRHGWPIGSGAIEGGGKHLITTRFKGNGRRWKVASLRNLLALRVHVFNHRDHPLLGLRNVA